MRLLIPAAKPFFRSQVLTESLNQHNTLLFLIVSSEDKMQASQNNFCFVQLAARRLNPLYIMTRLYHLGKTKAVRH